MPCSAGCSPQKTASEKDAKGKIGKNVHGEEGGGSRKLDQNKRASSHALP